MRNVTVANKHLAGELLFDKCLEIEPAAIARSDDLCGFMWAAGVFISAVCLCDARTGIVPVFDLQLRNNRENLSD